MQYPLKNKGKRAGLRAGFWLLLSSSVLTGCLEIPDTLLVSDNNQTTAARCQYPSLAQSSALPSSFSLLSWNIYKQQSDWQPELEQWLDNSELLVLQEAKASPELQDWLQLQDYRWSQVAAFNWKNTENGVLTAAKSPATQSCGQRLLEPATRIPKSLLFSYYSLEDSPQQLLLVNLHAINFSLRGRTYKEQLQMISREISDYSGPVIVAGDFNRWNARREGFLSRWAHKEQLTEALPTPDHRTRFMGYALDAVFYRGLELEHAKSMESEASDHNALQMRFRLPS